MPNNVMQHLSRLFFVRSIAFILNNINMNSINRLMVVQTEVFMKYSFEVFFNFLPVIITYLS